jgi:hypothetical protein
VAAGRSVRRRHTVITCQYGDGPARKSKLGADYDGVQYLVDQGVGKP